MSNLESIVEDLKTLPPNRLKSATDYIHKLRTITDAERANIIDPNGRFFDAEEGDELARIIEGGCVQVDERDW